MASHVITADVTVENYGEKKIWTNCHNYFAISNPSDTIYISRVWGGDGLFYNSEGCFNWDRSEVPRGKKITKVVFHVYAKYSYGPQLYAKIYTSFAEIVLKAGWNVITIQLNVDIYNPMHLSQNSTLECSDAAHAEIWSHLASDSSKRPYAEITYEDVPPNEPSSLYPNNIDINPRNQLRFSWKHNSGESTKQKGFTLQYSINDGATWTTVTQTTENQYYDMLANTLPAGEILWRLKTKDQNDLESPYANGKFNTIIIPPGKPIPKTPLTGYLDGESPIKFEWEFVQGVSGDIQSKYDLEYSLDQGASWTKITHVSDESFHIVPANTFSSEKVYWRVKTYNQFGDASPYSDISSFHVIASPPTPQISNASNNAKPLIKWNAAEQQLFELQILQDNKILVNTGRLVGANTREYKIDEYLLDGEYSAKLRVINQYDLASSWAELDFIISTTKPDKPMIEVYNGKFGTTIKTISHVVNGLVYRGNICIGSIGNITENKFVDYTGENNREYEYFVRAVDENDNFNDSDKRTGKCKFRYNTIATKTDPGNFLELKYGLNSIPGKTTRISNTGNLLYFDGRKHPVADFAGFRELNKTLAFHLKSQAELEHLIDLVDKKETLIYRDAEGQNIEGVVFHIDFERVIFGYRVDFIITKVGERSD